MAVEGALAVTLRVADGAIAEVQLRSTRPVHASRVFHGMSAPAALTLIPHLFAVCGTAQACAAAAAIEAAQGVTATRDDLRRRRLLLLMETAQEHLWRLCVDSARQIGDAPDLSAAAKARTLVPRLQRALFARGGRSAHEPLHHDDAAAIIDALDQLLAEQIFGTPPDAWCEQIAAAAWWHRGGALAPRLLQMLDGAGVLNAAAATCERLPALDVAALDGRLQGDAADEFIAAPTHDGVPCETTPLARLWDDPALGPTRQQFGSALAARYTALLLELARLPAQLRALLHDQDHAGGTIHAAAPRAGVGLAQVDAARGRLIHRVELGYGAVIDRYQIVAPTEWNFHPRGIVSRALQGCAARDGASAKRQAELLIQAVDPCVGFEVILHA